MRRAVPLLSFAAVAILALGAWVGGRHADWLPGPVRSAVVGDSDTAVVREAIDTVHETYYRKIPRGELADDAIAGIVKKLGDRFSNYFNPAEYKRFRQAQSSEFSGVGLQVSPSKAGLRVESVYDGSPAKRAGLRSGDVIVQAGPKSLRGLSQDAAVALVKGPPGTDVKLAWVRGGKRIARTVQRATVTVPVVASTLKTQGGCKVGVVGLAQFSSGAHAEVYAAMKRLKQRGAKAFVLDLRGNGGGLVSEAQLIASAFLTDGPIVTTRGRTVPSRTLNATGDAIWPKGPVTVLVDKGTASASEIVTGALQDRDRATVVGTRTFGKGVFQEVIDLSNGGALDITAGQYFTPKGRNLGGRGVKTGAGIAPDVKAADDPKTARDEGLGKALSVTGAKCPNG